MIAKLSFVLSVLVFYGSQSVQSSICGFGYELLSTRIEYLEDLLRDQQSSLKKCIEDGGITKQTSSIVARLEAENKAMREEIGQQNDRILSMLSNMSENCASVKAGPAIPRSCAEEPTKKSGPYLLQPFPEENPFFGYCQQQSFGGGWLVFLQRFDGSVSFDRDWNEFRVGFGETSGEFWMGFNRLHRLTRGRNHTLLVELETFGGTTGYAMYDGFEIGSEMEKFSLKVLGSYSGTAGDSLERQRGMPFTTKDRDNDPWKEGNCATFYKGAWWHNWNSKSSLNGPYGWRKSSDTNFWVTFTNDAGEGLKVTKMMMREA